ncbi:MULTISPECIES: HPr kinase/phosphorylase [unclassified Rhizobium]|uniref:HPr kinase/phosphorylase n=1 Tax=unclassified Rhizobium TaxID=2613769 RepID=UPI0016099C83|nr:MULTISPECIES: HPr kinase/phosphorylase [unclassified Rhizobium]MBB3290540.1 serine kinase of HPr protein (carbohydrate metabolism regulator) [Rhizobium sp. BK252]MBB3405396.1 serine kinase of HPr protein (carbohydrate metabolism regulator) [Rhizobium sp. BK289]MBB3417943.1 serine kinase of HPr protein (carbohydrate metabolism regulator) [Rhizobium sp. BK284]MBB3485746.1 serine kinase of HPr protein (carbohydrate metabolism regulator) [Rhizobium sp. BK347]
MAGEATNIHATAIVIGTTGLLFLGPSGSGKSTLAFSCLTAARPLGLAASLIADDRVLITEQNGSVLAKCPPSIAGLMEIRYTGIVRMPYISEGEMHFAIRPVDPESAERLPPEDEQVDISDSVRLPLIRLAATSANPLAIIMAKIGASFG